MKHIVGIFEKVSFPEFSAIGSVTAKVDTGAYSGSLHCTKIHLEQQNEIPTLHFSPFDHPEISVQTTTFISRQVRSSNGTTQKRYFIETNILMRGKVYPILLSLADRSSMRWPVLIGRKFLADHGFLVDVSKVKP